MSRKNTILFIITGIVAIALIGGGFAYRYYASFKNVTITVKNPEVTADIYRRDPDAEESDYDVKIDSVKGTKTLSLQPDKYYAVPREEKFNPQQVSFEVVDKDLNVTVNPGFSTAYLDSLLKKELPAINAAITSTYQSVLAGFTVNKGKLYEDGSWYGTTLVQNVSGGEYGDVYRAVLHKKDGAWQFAATPEIILTAPAHRDIPQAILFDLNQQSGF